MKLNILKICIAVALTSCAAPSQTGLKGDQDREYAEQDERSEEDFAKTHSGCRKLLNFDCEYDFPALGQSSADVLCTVLDDAGSKADISTLNDPTIVISKVSGLRSTVYNCNSNRNCHWQVTLQNTDGDPNLGAKVAATKIGLRSSTNADGPIFIVSSPKAKIDESYSSVHSRECVNGICLGAKGASCQTTCLLQNKTYDQQRALQIHNLNHCTQMTRVLIDLWTLIMTSMILVEMILTLPVMGNDFLTL